MKRQNWLPVFLTIIWIILASCGDKDSGSPSDSASSPPASKVRLLIVSGSENAGLEPLVRQFARKEDADIRISYMGSIDMTLMLSEQGKNTGYDAVWPANSLWINLGDRQKIVKYTESIMRSPVVLGVKKSIAERLGWTDRQDITIADILAAAETGKLRFVMTSATQSNSGASAYLGFLHALAGSPDILQQSHLQNPDVQARVRKLLSGVNRSSGSSGWLKDTLVQHYDRFQAMFNYEAMMIEANQAFVAQGMEPLYVIYPVDGIMLADSPLGYIDKGDAQKEALFKKLQAFLTSDGVQAEIMKQGRRTGLIGINPDSADRSVFNPAWGIDVNRIISTVPIPDETVIREALDLYQTALRKPSCTAYVVDVSGSMGGSGIEELKEAMTTLLDPEQARRYLLQSSPGDIHIILPFNSVPLEGIRAKGNSSEVLATLLNFIQGLQTGGGTDIYAAAVRGLELIGEVENPENYFPSVILMTDGRSGGSFEAVREKLGSLSLGNDIPVFSITFGDADPAQLKELSDFTAGRVFEGTNLVKAFRNAKGYN